MAQTSPEVASLLVPGMHGAKKCRRACRKKPGPRPGPFRLVPPIYLTRSGIKCRAAQQPLILPANGHRPPPSQAREANCLASIALEASGLGNLGRQGQQRRKSGQGERTGTLFDCIWLDTPIGCASLRPRPPAARHQTISAFEHQILLGLC